MCLGHFKRLLGLKGKSNGLVLTGDLELYSFRVKRLVGIIRYWEKAVSLPNAGLVDTTSLEVLQDRRKAQGLRR